MNRNLHIDQTLVTTIRDRAGVVFEGPVEALSSYNDTGPFDVLSLHANFISIIHNAVVLHLKGNVEQTISLETGVMRVHENKVEVYLGIIR